MENNGDVGSVEQLDWVGRVLATVSDGLDGQIDAETWKAARIKFSFLFPTLEVDDDQENDNSGQKVHQVGQVGAVEGLVQSADLVGFSGQKMEKCNDGSLELGTSADVDSGWWECLPDDSFADVSRDEERDTGSETVALGEELVQQENNQTGDEKLNDNQAADSSSHLRRITVHSSQNVDNSLAKGHDHTEKLLGTGEKGTKLRFITSFY